MSPAECPCEFHGTLHPPGSVVTEDCNAWSVSTAWREEPGGARACCWIAYLDLRNPEKARATHSASLRSKGMSLDPRGVGLFATHLRNGTLWAGAWDSVLASRAGRSPSRSLFQHVHRREVGVQLFRLPRYS